MNYPIIICDFLSLIFLTCSLITLLMKFKSLKLFNSRVLLVALIMLMTVYNLCNFMEWTGFGDIFDRYGDFIGILIPAMWVFFFYAMMQGIFLKDIRTSENRFKDLSFHDALTKIYNRAYYENELHRIDMDVSRFEPISIFSIDIDGLKFINDTFGHESGDTLLKEVARIIAVPFRKIDLVARIGGDEFCILLAQVDEKKAIDKKNEITELIKRYNSGHPTFPMSLSIGMATSQAGAKESIFNITRRADNNMYEHKLVRVQSKKGAIIDLLLSALEERDFIAEGHAKRLSDMARTMAVNLNLTDDERTNLMLVAKLHDIGKIGISDAILFKKGKLLQEEYEKIKKHSEIGHKIAVRSKELAHISDLILHHHESWDGSGYPSGLKGEKIPKECRILAILDAYDAMTNERPYRKVMPREQAIDELKRNSGVKFDPAILDIFLKNIEEKD